MWSEVNQKSEFCILGHEIFYLNLKEVDLFQDSDDDLEWSADIEEDGDQFFSCTQYSYMTMFENSFHEHRQSSHTKNSNKKGRN